MTTECLVTLPNQFGLHLRAAATLAKRASQFDCVIRIGNGTKSVEATSTIGLVTLGVAQFGQVTVKAEGHDADVAVQSIRQLVDACFDIAE
jgi:phosphotransferase system HPr (HPr) family protein